MEGGDVTAGAQALLISCVGVFLPACFEALRFRIGPYLTECCSHTHTHAHTLACMHKHCAAHSLTGLETWTSYDWTASAGMRGLSGGCLIGWKREQNFPLIDGGGGGGGGVGVGLGLQGSSAAAA